MDGARVWTGFNRRAYRGNLINIDYNNDRNDIDPMMEISVRQRDSFPKTKLGGGYLGDGYPLCTDLPRQHFLKPGARFTLTGSVSH